MTIEGSIKRQFPEKTGKGAKGTWRTQDFLVVYGEGQYPKEVVLTAWNDTITEMHNATGRRAKFSIEPTSRQSSDNPDKYFTNVKVWRVQ